MLYKKQGFPEESELVICTVTKIYPNSVFCNLNEYDKSGMIHISEIAPGRIRNIRDYVEENKIIVCKVLAIHPDKGHIDLSLRRVTDSLRKAKLDEVKQEQKAEKILEIVAAKHKLDVKSLYKQIADKVMHEFDGLAAYFEAVSTGAATLDSLGLQKAVAEDISVMIQQRIKAPEVEVGGTFTVSTYSSDGVNIIKEAFKQIETQKNITIKYLGAGKYKLDITSEDYKTAEKILKDSVDPILKFVKQHDGIAEFMREEK